MSTRALYKNLSAKWHMARSEAPNYYFGSPSISPKLIELGIEIWCAGGCVGTQLVKPA